jgi:hypothetical protein
MFCDQVFRSFGHNLPYPESQETMICSNGYINVSRGLRQKEKVEALALLRFIEIFCQLPYISAGYRIGTNRSSDRFNLPVRWNIVIRILLDFLLVKR